MVNNRRNNLDTEASKDMGSKDTTSKDMASKHMASKDMASKHTTSKDTEASKDMGSRVTALNKVTEASKDMVNLKADNQTLGGISEQHYQIKRNVSCLQHSDFILIFQFS